MSQLEIYRDRFAESGWEVFESAVVETTRRGQNYLGVEHLLYALIQVRAEFFLSTLRSLSDNPEALTMLSELIEERVRNGARHEGKGIRLAPETIMLFKRALAKVRFNGRQRIEATDLFIILMMEERSLLRALLSKLLADPRAKRKQERDLFAVIESVSGANNSANRQKYRYLEGETVRIKSGPFAAFTGTVEMVDIEKGLLRVRVSIMGRGQPVELRFIDVEKLKLDK